jgi:hypothetical protein
MARYSKALGAISLLALMVSNTAAAQRPHKVMTIAHTCKLQAAATEILALRFQAIDQGTTIRSKLAGPAFLPETRTYRAEVLRVYKSIAGLRAGQTITIQDLTGAGASQIGGASEGTLAETVFLAPMNNGTYRFAALERSFKPVSPGLCRDGRPPHQEIAGKSAVMGQH